MNGNESVVADGKETRVDGLVEVAIIVGSVFENVLLMPWIEGIVTLIVAFFIGETAFEIVRQSVRSLLMKSVGNKAEIDLKKSIEQMPGVVEVQKMKTFFTGKTAVIIIKVISRSSACSQRLLKKGIEAITVPVLKQHDINDAKFYIRFADPPENSHREAVAVDERGYVAWDVSSITRVIVCDVEDGIFKRETEHDVKVGTLAAFLEKKHVSCIHCLAPKDVGYDECRTRGIEARLAPHWSLAILGI